MRCSSFKIVLRAWYLCTGAITWDMENCPEISDRFVFYGLPGGVVHWLALPWQARGHPDGTDCFFYCGLPGVCSYC